MSQYKFLTIFLSFFGLIFSGTLFAEREDCFAEQCQTSCLQIGGNYTHANIKVGGQQAFKGNLGGIQGSYEYQHWNGFYAGLRAVWTEGKTKNSFDERRLTYVDVQERIGYTFSLACDDLSLTVFSGLGYRYLGHKLKQVEELLIKFEYNEFYLPLGILTEYSFCSCWAVGLDLTWMPQFYPTVRITPLKGARWVLKSTSDNLRVALPLTYFFTEDKCWSVILKPFYERWEDGRSTAKAFNGEELGLPKNSYNFWGAELNFVFAF